MAATIKLVPTIMSNDDHEQIFMSSDLMNHLQIDPNQDIRICFGKKFTTVKARSGDFAQNECLLSQIIIKGFSLPVDTYDFQYIFTKKTLYLGPVVALLAAFTKDENTDPHFSAIHTFCEELQTRISEVGGFFYVFTFADFSTKGVNGYYFDNGKWIQAKLPLPDCIYNRIHSRKIEQTLVFRKFRRELEQLHIPLFNDHYLSKWEVYQQLMENEKIHPYLPETMTFTTENLKLLFEKYHTVFIKPDHGSQGRNIIKVVKEAGQVFLHASQNPAAPARAKNHSMEAILEQLNPLLHNRSYIIQQGIPLLEYHARAMDFRVLVHKKAGKLWKVTSLVARISAEQQFVSNIAKGGTIMKPPAALAANFNSQTVQEIMPLLKELALEAAATVSQHTSGLLGELGIDIGIDQTGKPWIIEINSKPSKNFEDSLKVRPSAKAIIRFCASVFVEQILKKEE